jgi:hypothetical protein
MDIIIKITKIVSKINIEEDFKINLIYSKSKGKISIKNLLFILFHTPMMMLDGLNL